MRHAATRCLGGGTHAELMPARAVAFLCTLAPGFSRVGSDALGALSCGGAGVRFERPAPTWQTGGSWSAARRRPRAALRPEVPCPSVKLGQGESRWAQA